MLSIIIVIYNEALRAVITHLTSVLFLPFDTISHRSISVSRDSETTFPRTSSAETLDSSNSRGTIASRITSNPRRWGPGSRESAVAIERGAPGRSLAVSRGPGPRSRTEWRRSSLDFKLADFYSSRCCMHRRGYKLRAWRNAHRRQFIYPLFHRRATPWPLVPRALAFPIAEPHAARAHLYTTIFKRIFTDRPRTRR